MKKQELSNAAERYTMWKLGTDAKGFKRWCREETARRIAQDNALWERYNRDGEEAHLETIFDMQDEGCDTERLIDMMRQGREE